MTNPDKPYGVDLPPSVAEMTARYLQRQVDAHAAGLGFRDVAGEVLPFEVLPVQPVDPRLAWDEATAVLSAFHRNDSIGTFQAPPDWSCFVASHEPAFALAFSAGNFPQLVRHLHPLLHAKKLSGLRPGTPAAEASPDAVEWPGLSQRDFPQLLITLGLLRVTRQFERAAELLRMRESEVPGKWQAAWANETAALAWHRGQVEEAEMLWQTQGPTPAALFNRGMAALFADRPADARPLLAKAVAQLPDDGGWHHLGSLYLALAEMRTR
jgi:hypothetical protein